MSASLTGTGVKSLGDDLREAGRLIADTTAPDRETAALVGPVAQATTPRRTGGTAAALRFGAGPDGPTVEVPGDHVVPLHWGAPANHQRAQPWVAEAFRRNEDRILTIYETHAEQVIDRI